MKSLPFLGRESVSVVDVVATLRQQTGCAAFGNPLELVDAMGLAPCPDHRVNDVRITGRIFRFGVDLLLRDRGSLIYRALASLLCAPLVETTDELMVPRCFRVASLHDLIRVQQFVRVSDLQRIFVGRRGSGLYAAQDLPPASQR